MSNMKSIIPVSQSNNLPDLSYTLPSTTYNSDITTIEPVYAPETAYANTLETEEVDLSLDTTSITDLETTILTNAEYEEYINVLTTGYQQEIELTTEMRNVTQEELDRVNNLLDKVEEKLKLISETTVTTTYNGIQENRTRTENRDEITNEITNGEFKTYQELLEYRNSQQETITNLEAIIYKNQQLIQTAKYDYLPLLETYQNYTISTINIDNLANCKEAKLTIDAQGIASYTISYTKYCELYGEVNPYEFYKIAKEKYPDYGITGLPNYTMLENLDMAIKINPELEKTYAYIYDTEGSDKAEEYLYTIEDQINQYAGQQKAEEFLSTLERNEDGSYDCSILRGYDANTSPALNPLLAMFLPAENQTRVAAKGIFDGIENFGAGLTAWLEGSDVLSTDEYEAMYILQALSSNEDFFNFLDDNYQMSQSIGNMLPSMAISAITANPTAGLVSLGISAGGNSYHQALVEGYDTTTAILYGAFSGASEALLESYLGAIPGLGGAAADSFKGLLQSAGQEFIEEFIQTYVSAGIDQTVLGEEVDYSELLPEAIQSGVYGGITGGIMNTPSLALSTINMSYINGQIQNGTITEQQLADTMRTMYPEETSNLTNKQIIEQYNGVAKNVLKSIVNQRNTTTSQAEMYKSLQEQGKIPSTEPIATNQDTVKTDTERSTIKAQDSDKIITDSSLEFESSIMEVKTIIDSLRTSSKGNPEELNKLNSFFENEKLTQEYLKNYKQLAGELLSIEGLSEKSINNIVSNLDPYSFQFATTFFNIDDNINLFKNDQFVKQYLNSFPIMQKLEILKRNCSFNDYQEIVSTTFSAIMQTGATSNPECIQLVIDTINAKVKSGNTKEISILETLIAKKIENPDFSINTDSDRNVSIDSKVLISEERLKWKDTIALFHEIGHFLFKGVFNDSKNKGNNITIRNWMQIRENAKQIASNGNLYNITIFLDSLFNQESKKQAEQNIISALESNGMTKERYIKLLTENYEYLIQNPNKLKERLIKKGYNEQLIKAITHSDYSAETLAIYEYNSVVNKERVRINLTNYEAYAALSDIIDSVFLGKKEDTYGRKFKLNYGHGQNYYENLKFPDGRTEKATISETEFRSYSEIMANFTAIKESSTEYALEILKELFGSEFYNTLENTYNQFYYKGDNNG